jgi:glycosyltransferase involved in cell wall biosynthesis
MKRELVSIIMPLYNGKLHIREAINSVLAQSYAQWELLIINDCSTDESEEIVFEYCKTFQNIQLLKTEVNSGPAAARNIGIKIAKGKYISFLDSDDIWVKDKLQKQIEFIERKNAAIVFSNYEKISHFGIIENRVVKLPKQVSYKSMLKINSIPCLTAMYDTEKLGKLFQHTDRYYISYEDYIMWLFVLKKGVIAYNTNNNLAFYRLSDKSLSRNKFKMITIRWNLYRQIEKLSFWNSLYNMCNYIFLGFQKYVI